MQYKLKKNLTKLRPSLKYRSSFWWQPFWQMYLDIVTWISFALASPVSRVQQIEKVFIKTLKLDSFPSYDKPKLWNSNLFRASYHDRNTFRLSISRTVFNKTYKIQPMQSVPRCLIEEKFQWLNGQISDISDEVVVRRDIKKGLDMNASLAKAM